MWVPHGEGDDSEREISPLHVAKESFVEQMGKVGENLDGGKQNVGAIETSERPASLFFAPEHMWMPADRRLQHEQQQASPPPPDQAKTTTEGTATISTPGIKALKIAAAEVSEAIQTVKEQSAQSLSTDSSGENFVTAENLTDDEDEGQVNVSDSKESDSHRPNAMVERVESKRHLSAWEGVSVFESDLPESSPPRKQDRSKSHLMSSTPPRVHFAGQTDTEGKRHDIGRGAMQRATQALADEAGGREEEESDTWWSGRSRYEDWKKTHGKHKTPWELRESKPDPYQSTANVRINAISMFHHS